VNNIMKKRRITIILGHPDKETLLGAFANDYEKAARHSGYEVRRVNVGDLNFDPILHKGYKVVQDLEPDLCKLQEDIKWCDHLVIFYPMWWSTMPSILKGVFDRMWLPGFAFRFNKNGLGWKRLLKGRSARIVVGSNIPPIIGRLIMGDTTNEIRKGILRFSGFSPIRKTLIGRMETMSERRKMKWKKKFESLGGRGV